MLVTGSPIARLHKRFGSSLHRTGKRAAQQERKRGPAFPPAPRVAGLSAIAPTTGGSARLHVGGMLGPRRQGKRASRPGQRLANASRWPSPNGKPFRGYPPAASRVVGCPSGGKPPWGRSPGRGRSRRISFPPRCPLLRLCHAASASRFRSSRVDGPEGSSCLDGLARFLLPEGTAFRAFGHPAWLVPKHLPALTTRSTLARRHRLRVRSPGLSMLRGSISRPDGPSFACRSM